jgi:hypothetical protein
VALGKLCFRLLDGPLAQRAYRLQGIGAMAHGPVQRGCRHGA